MKQSVFLLLFGLLLVPSFGQGPSTMKSLLQHLDANPAVFKKMAISELQFSFGSTSLVEGGLIGEDTFRKDSITLVKSYGYYALRSSADRQLRKRLGLSGRHRSNWRDSSWNVQRERDWTGITLMTASNSIAGALLQETVTLGAVEVQPCLRRTKVNGVAVEQKTYAVAHSGLLVFEKYLFPEGARYEIRLSFCPVD